MQIEMVAIDEIREYERNPRVIGEDAIAAVARSIESFGFKVPVVIDTDGTLIAGHTRVRAARQLGLATVPAIRATDLTPEQVKAFRLADNQVWTITGWIAWSAQPSPRRCRARRCSGRKPNPRRDPRSNYQRFKEGDDESTHDNETRTAGAARAGMPQMPVRTISGHLHAGFLGRSHHSPTRMSDLPRADHDV